MKKLMLLLCLTLVLLSGCEKMQYSLQDVEVYNKRIESSSTMGRSFTSYLITLEDSKNRHYTYLTRSGDYNLVEIGSTVDAIIYTRTAEEGYYVSLIPVNGNQIPVRHKKED